MLARHIDFVAIAAAVDRKLSLGGSGRGGRPPPVVNLIEVHAVARSKFTAKLPST